jgi:hypothetical protein
VDGTLDEQARQFMIMYRDAGIIFVHEKVTSFIFYQIRRAQEKEISQATIPNYLKALILSRQL